MLGDAIPPVFTVGPAHAEIHRWRFETVAGAYWLQEDELLEAGSDFQETEASLAEFKRHTVAAAL